jgi:hypothetical protein
MVVDMEVEVTLAEVISAMLFSGTDIKDYPLRVNGKHSCESLQEDSLSA